MQDGELFPDEVYSDAASIDNETSEEEVTHTNTKENEQVESIKETKGKEIEQEDDTFCDIVPYLAPRRTSFLDGLANIVTRPNTPTPTFGKPSTSIHRNDGNDHDRSENDSEDNHEDKTILQEQLESLFTIVDPPVETIPVCSYLLRRIGVDGGEFRPGQQAVVLAMLQRRSTLAILPTGWGKSLCFQLPMLAHRALFTARLAQWQRTSQGEPPEARFAIVVSPLLALMADQSDRIAGDGALRSVVLSGSTAAPRVQVILNELSSPHCNIDLLFVSPERIVRHGELRSVIERHAGRIAFICVDEAHCVSQWAFDFRPAFMYVHRILAGIGDDAETRPPFLCLTATAAPAVVSDLQSLFRIERTVTIPYRRDNLHLESVPLVSSTSFTTEIKKDKATATAAAVAKRATKTNETDALMRNENGKERVEKAKEEQCPPTQRALQERLLEAVMEMPKPMLVYVQTRVDADELASFISTKLGATRRTGAKETMTTKGSKDAPRSSIFTSATHERMQRTTANTNADISTRALLIRSYHAALDSGLRRRTQQQFMRGDIDVLVATVAFGMGIDKPNIRAVVHAAAPGSLESYIQETGRAGRDGKPSICRLLYNPFDYYSLRSRILAAAVSPAEMLAIVSALFGCPTTRVGERIALMPVAQLSEELMMGVETVETVLFMLLAQENGLLREMRGTVPSVYRITRAETVVERSTTEKNELASAHKATRKRSRCGDGASNACLGAALAQLEVLDGVFELCRGTRRIDSVVTAANELGMSLTDFQFRLRDLMESGFVLASGAAPAYVVVLGAGFAEMASPTGVSLVAKQLWEQHNARLSAQCRGLEVMFGVLQHPTHEAVRWGLEWDVQRETAWQPPSRSMSRLEAVSIVNDFVEKNRTRIHSTYEAARALLGVVPKSVVRYGRYAGELPLSSSWYVSSPYFGMLREFDFDWLLKALGPHRLDELEKNDANGRLASAR